MLSLSESIEVEASPHEVWKAATELRRYREWNPFIREARGKPCVAGNALRLRVRTRFGLPLAFRATVVACYADRELRWRGHVLAPWLANGEHVLAVEPLGSGRVRFEQREVFTGLLPWLVTRLLERETRLGFRAMNRALRDRIERAQLARNRSPCASV